MNIFLTGVTGFLGRHVAAACLEQGHMVTALVRKESAFKDDIHPSIGTRIGDLTTPGLLAEYLQGADAIIHSAADTSLAPFVRKDQWSPNVQGVSNLVHAARLANIKRFVHVSSASTMESGTPQAPSDESSVLTATNVTLPYIQSKLAGEQLLLKEFIRDSFPVSILHPSFILGPGDVRRGSTRLIQLFARGGMQVHASGGKNVVDVRDVAKAAVQAVSHGRAGDRYLLANEYVSYAQLIEMVKGFSNKRVIKMELPKVVWKGVGYAGTIIGGLSGSVLSLNHKSVPLAFSEGHFNCQKARRELAFEPRPAAETVKDTVTWIINQKK